jgi:hypothetical protein
MARGIAVAVRRSAGESRTLRLDSASPSGSRTVGCAAIRTGRSRSRTIRRTTSTCCASFAPKNATSGCTMFSSFDTTVVTPWKCSGPRWAPSSRSVSGPETRTSVTWPPG